ncbi:MAG: TIR domain-containing protein, partial [Anaerolineae bacterium]|nr:TIR domain-containing protein [Anaerolineae bacterium]
MSIKQLASVLARYMKDSRTRQRLNLFAAPGLCDPLLSEIDYEGAPIDYTAGLINACVKRGVDGKRFLEGLVQEICQGADLDYQELSALIDALFIDTTTAPLPAPNPHLRDYLFIAYHHTDREWVERLAGDLRNKGGHTTWIDFEGIRGGDVWRQAIRRGIRAAGVVLVVLSPEAVRSEWVKVEIQTAREYGKRVIPLLHSPVSDAGRAALGVEDLQYRDFTGDYTRAFTVLLGDLPKPAYGVPGHCQRLAARLDNMSWGIERYIQEEAWQLPIDASPYEGGVGKGEPENLIVRLWQSHRTIVLGEPGMGKTVAVERLAWELARNEPPIVPVLVKLLEYEGGPLLEWVRRSLRSTDEIKLRSVEETRQFLEDSPFDCYFLFDGLNEVRPACRASLESEINKLAPEFARHRLVITSRVEDESWRRLRRGSGSYDTLLIKSIRPAQAQQYLAAHLGAQESEVLWGKLDPRMRNLTATPLLLWFIKETWRKARRWSQPDEIRLPENRAELYRDFIAEMLAREEERRHDETTVPQPSQMRALEQLALEMQVGHVQKQLPEPTPSHAPPDEGVLKISHEKALDVLGGDENLLQTLLRSSLLRHTKPQQIGFAPHQTIQEHFAACALKDEIMHEAREGWLARRVRRVVNPERLRWLDYAADSWWTETFIQLAGLVSEADSNTLARAVAEVNPWLALWCVEEGRKVDKATRRAIEARSIALVHSDQVEDRRRAAQALAKLQKGPRVLEPLAILAADADDEVGEIALDAIKTVHGAAASYLIAQLGNLNVTPPARLRIGRALAEIGDPRKGVGLRADGLPDIDWVTIPAGEFIYQDDKRLRLEAFDIARYPITYAQFQAFIDAPGGFGDDVWWEGLARREAQPGEQYFKYANHPRE